MTLVAYSAPLAASSSDAPSGWLTVTVMEIFRPELKLNMIETYDVYSELHCCTGWQTLRSPMWEGRSARRAVQLQLEQREAGRACLTGLTSADGRWPSFSRSRDFRTQLHGYASTHQRSLRTVLWIVLPTGTASIVAAAAATSAFASIHSSSPPGCPPYPYPCPYPLCVPNLALSIDLSTVSTSILR